MAQFVYNSFFPPAKFENSIIRITWTPDQSAFLIAIIYTVYVNVKIMFSHHKFTLCTVQF